MLTAFGAGCFEGAVVEEQGEHGCYAKDRCPDSGTREHSQRIHLTDSFLATGSLRFTCSGRIPKAMMRAGRSRTALRLRSALAGAGSEGAPSGLKREETTRRWTTD